MYSVTWVFIGVIFLYFVLVLIIHNIDSNVARVNQQLCTLYGQLNQIIVILKKIKKNTRKDGYDSEE